MPNYRSLAASAVFPRAEDMDKGKAEIPERQRAADRDFAHEILLRNAAAGLKGIAVEEKIAGDGAALQARKDIGAEIRLGLIDARAGPRRIDLGRAGIGGQVEPLGAIAPASA